jgi:alpha-tubulin suppressor-like RCC1 family protein
LLPTSQLRVVPARAEMRAWFCIIVTGVALAGAPSWAKTAAVGFVHACAISEAIGLQCWGTNSNGQLGYGQSTNTQTNAPFGVAVSLDASPLSLATGIVSTCALLMTGKVQCWGDNEYGQLGTGSAGGISGSPQAAVSLPLPASQISSSRFFVCALVNSGEVYCWGDNADGEIGNNTAAGIVPSPALVRLPLPAVKVTAGGAHACALLASGNVTCWGANDNCQLGVSPCGDTIFSAPAPLVILGEAAVDVAAGEDHTCAVLASGYVMCWGSNDHGQLGIGNADPMPAPSSTQPVGLHVSVSGTAAGVEAGEQSTCVWRVWTAACCAGATTATASSGTAPPSTCTAHRAS